MSIVKEKTYLDPVSKIQRRTGGQGIKQKDRHHGVFRICSCLKEFKTANFETLIPEMKLSIQSKPSVTKPPIQPNTYLPINNLPAVHITPPNLNSISWKKSWKTCRVEESGFNFLQPAERSPFYLVRSTESPSIVTGRATALCAFPKAPEVRY